MNRLFLFSILISHARALTCAYAHDTAQRYIFFVEYSSSYTTNFTPPTQNRPERAVSVTDS